MNTNVYGTYPVQHTSEIFKRLSGQSEDPLTQVVCIAWDKRWNEVTSYGVNRILRPLVGVHGVQAVVATERHEDKKFLMVHAEVDFLNKAAAHNPPEKFKYTAVYLSLQPCMECVKMLLQAGVTHIEWQHNNRHQEEQAIIQKYMQPFTYKQNPDGLMLSVPTWILPDGLR